MTKRDYYEVLGVARTADASEIKKAFRQLARQHHPDVNKDADAPARFKELGEAYDVLSDPQKRQVYDAYGHDGLRGGGYQPSFDFMQGFPDLNDLFAEFFGGGFARSQGRGRGPATGENLRFDMELDFMEAAFGVKKEISIEHLVHCDPCKGSGSEPGSQPAMCQTCAGSGQIRHTTQTIIGHFTQIGTCPRCQGSGTMIMDPCRTCQGKGRSVQEKELSITIPAGVDTGTRLRVANEGDSGPMGAPPGDLYVVLHVKPHEIFKRDGYEVYSAIPITYPQLALGDEIDIPTLEGIEQIKIPAGTQHGQVFTMKHLGIPILNTNGQRGNYHVQVILDVPKKLSGEEKKLLQQLKELHDDDHPAKKPKSASGEKESFVNRFRATFSPTG